MSRQRNSHGDRAAVRRSTITVEPVAAVSCALSEREKDVLVHRLSGVRTVDELTDLYEVTRERIRKIEAHAFSNLGHPSRAKFLRDYGNDAATLLKSVVFRVIGEETLAATARAELAWADILWNRGHRDCAHCGRDFRPKSTGRPARFCSNACRQASHRARHATHPTNSTLDALSSH